MKQSNLNLYMTFESFVEIYREDNEHRVKVNTWKTKEMLFLTKDEFEKFSYEMMDKPTSYYAFNILYWTGIRTGELLALTKEDFNFSKSTLRINKSYQRIDRKDVITYPKTQRSNRVIALPAFIYDELQDYIDTHICSRINKTK